jgi:hypothetical protein
MKLPSALDSLSLSTLYLRMIADGSDAVLATGTGFTYFYENQMFLITNGHNITRMNPEQTERISDSIAFPKRIDTRFKMAIGGDPDRVGITGRSNVDLYKDEDFTQPNWFVHPGYGYLVDVVAVPIERTTLPGNAMLCPINDYAFDKDYEPRVSDDVFILGYPFDIVGEMEYPLWKRGTIASEPVLNIGNLPKILIDTATRAGMSGSPVIMQRTGIHGIDDITYRTDRMPAEKPSPKPTKIGTIHDFLGVYSGRIGGQDEFQAQLGIVWKGYVIEEILQAKCIGDIGFQNK